MSTEVVTVFSKMTPMSHNIFKTRPQAAVWQCDRMPSQTQRFLVPYTPVTVLPAMVTVTYLPLFITVLFRGMPGMWKSHHRLMLCWLVVMQALFPGRKTVEELARW